MNLLLFTSATIMSHIPYLPLPTRIPVGYCSKQRYSFQSESQESDTVLVGALCYVYELVGGRYEQSGTIFILYLKGEHKLP
jgi:hypothetical protein